MRRSLFQFFPMYAYNNPEVLESDSFNGDSHMLSELLLQSLVKEMNKPEMSHHALSWKRLHLSRAKLKASSRTSALLAGFAMVAMVEVQLTKDMPWQLLVAFSVCTTLLVAIHMLALMISTCILPHIEAVASVHGVTAVAESPHERMHIYIETAWAFSTVFGIILFLSEIAILCWVKFHEHMSAAIGATILLIPLLVIFVGFAVHFYRKLVTHQYERSEEGLRELESIMKNLQGDGGELGVEMQGVCMPSSTSANGPGMMAI